MTSQIKYDRRGEADRLTLKNSISYFNRELNLSDYSFKGIQLSTFSEAVYNFNLDKFGGMAGWNQFIHGRFFR
ncbi:MAG: hypothetical protein U5K00_07755 [Melioribacteraceae bacterium]|nr:hypothetical protein [Melioribacteraceae bacterium]